MGNDEKLEEMLIPRCLIEWQAPIEMEIFRDSGRPAIGVILEWYQLFCSPGSPFSLHL